MASAALVATLAFAAAAAPAVAKGVYPNDFKALAKTTGVKQVNDKAVRYKQTVKSGGKRIGKAVFKLTFGKRLKIAGTWRLKGGRIKVRGRLKRRGNESVAPIVDGTGKFKGVRGKLTMKSETPRRLRQEFDFR